MASKAWAWVVEIEFRENDVGYLVQHDSGRIGALDIHTATFFWTKAEAEKALDNCQVWPAEYRVVCKDVTYPMRLRIEVQERKLRQMNEWFRDEPEN